uniref:Uncharacterized protein n=1 Tax=Arundo donax TaxID=35708 RepID=A0A0A8YDI0_ARUDO
MHATRSSGCLQRGFLHHITPVHGGKTLKNIKSQGRFQ